MTDHYVEVFNARGHKYDNAMKAFPHARDKEFQTLLHGVDLGTVATALDIPAGGGYLRPFLGKDIKLVELEPAADFGGDLRTIDLEALTLPETSTDLIVSLAALHHVSNKSQFFAATLCALRLGGSLCVGDVAHGSVIADFLDGYVGKHNSTGHSGDYLAADATASARFATENTELVRCELRPCPWIFNDEYELVSFCRDLFGLIDVNDHALLEALDKYIGVSDEGDGLALQWELLFLQYRKIAQ